MKKLFFALIPFAFFACKKNDERSSILVPLRPVAFEFPSGSSPADTYHFYIENEATDVEDAIIAAGKTWADVSRIEGASAVIEADFLDAQFKWFDEVSMRFYATDQTNFLEAFYRYPVPVDAGNRLDLIPSLADLKGNMKPDEVSFDLAIRPRGVTPESLPSRFLGSVRVFF